MSERFEDQMRAALATAEDESAAPEERAEMLMEMAMGLQQKPKSPEQLLAAVTLYDKALAVCPPEQKPLAARIATRKATALQAIPDSGTAYLEQAREIYAGALPVLTQFGTREECAEIEMNLGLVLQGLAENGRAPLADAIAAYQRALKVFDKRYPVEFAILQNNLATAFLSIPMSDERGKTREALAVQCFEEGLKAVSLIDHPREYAMLQNNLGNALQYASTSHAVENNLRALEAYDEALKVRTPRDTPIEYANTLANKANCLWNLPDADDSENGANLKAARDCFAKAESIFSEYGIGDKAGIASAAIREIDRELGALYAAA